MRLRNINLSACGGSDVSYSFIGVVIVPLAPS